jgi:hypothetical protein
MGGIVETGSVASTTGAVGSSLGMVGVFAVITDNGFAVVALGVFVVVVDLGLRRVEGTNEGVAAGLLSLVGTGNAAADKREDEAGAMIVARVVDELANPADTANRVATGTTTRATLETGTMLVLEIVETESLLEVLVGEIGTAGTTALMAGPTLVWGGTGVIVILVETIPEGTGTTELAGRGANVSAEPDCCTTTGFGVSSEPTPEANSPPSKTPAKAAMVSNFARPERSLGNPSDPQESDRNDEVPESEPENAASSTRSRSELAGPTSCALATIVEGFTKTLRRRSHASQSCA